jgi:hypothetical protein
MPWWRTLWTSGCHSPFHYPAPMTDNPFGVSSFSHKHQVLSKFARKGSWRFAQGIFVLDGILALVLSLVSSLCLSTRRIIDSFKAYRRSNVTTAHSLVQLKPPPPPLTKAVTSLSVSTCPYVFHQHVHYNLQTQVQSSSANRHARRTHVYAEPF